MPACAARAAAEAAGHPRRRLVYVGAVAFDLRLPYSHSLKEKRAIIKPILDGARNRYRVAAAEVGGQDLWQRARLGVAVVSATPSHATDVLDEVERFVWSFPEVEVITADRTWIDGDA